jgi:hypothetical protein
VSRRRTSSAASDHRKGPRLGETASIAFGHRWHKRSGYRKRSMVENAVFRYKSIIGRGMRSCSLEGQRVDVQLACRILNTMTRLGMPDSYRVE